VEFVDALGFFPLLTAVVLGSLTLFRSDRFSQLSLTYAVAAAGMLVVVLGLPLFGLNLFLPGRWYAFMYAPMAIIAAIGVRYLSTRLSSRTVVAGLLVLALVFPGAMLASQKAALGDPMFDDHYPRYSGTSSELAAVETVSAIHPDEAAPLQTDHPFRTLFVRWQGEEVDGQRSLKTGPSAPMPPSTGSTRPTARPPRGTRTTGYRSSYRNRPSAAAKRQPPLRQRGGPLLPVARRALQNDVRNHHPSGRVASHTDLAVAAGYVVAVTAVLALVGDPPTAVAVPLALPVPLFAPGYAVVTAISPARAAPRAPRALATASASADATTVSRGSNG